MPGTAFQILIIVPKMTAREADQVHEGEAGGGGRGLTTHLKN